MLTASVEYRVPYADTDQMGFVYYGNYLTYFERSRNELMRSAGFTYKRLEELGLGLPVIEAKVNYRRPAKYDDVIRIEADCEFCGGIRLQVNCRVFCGDVLLAEGYTIHAFMDLKTGRPTRPCQEFLDALEENNQEDKQCVR
ncbi:MAG: acyl-CoA thioesterase [Victivallales bacterium]|nr:acyl-CoA thioesterase [Victivallales bacterium]